MKPALFEHILLPNIPKHAIPNVPTSSLAPGKLGLQEDSSF